jgi:hypothetical protein
MKRIIYFLLTICISLSTYAQTWQFSVGFHFDDQYGTIIDEYNPGTAQGIRYFSTDVKELKVFPGLGFSYYHPFYSTSENFSLGLQSGFEFFGYKADEQFNGGSQTLTSQSSSPLEIGFNIPLLAMLRLGSLSTRDNSEGFGFAIGAGGAFSGFSFQNENGMMLPFTLCTEIIINNWGLRFDLPLTKYKSYYQSYTGDIPKLTNSFFTFHVIIGIGRD